jgi:threonyl-tRNA synthetase
VSNVTITLPDGSQRAIARGTRVREFAAAALPQSVVRKALAALVDGRMVDLTYPLDRDVSLRLVTPDGPAALALYRHSTAHLLAAAVTALFPGVQCGIGPPTDEGFFYDFVTPRPFLPEDLERIEAKMRELAAADLPYERQMWPRQEAIEFFTARGEPLKVQLIEEKTAGEAEVSCYTIKDRDTFVDFCVGPHVPSTGRLRAFKVLSASNAYWNEFTAPRFSRTTT